VIVVTDRIVLNKQLQRAIYQLEYRQGIVQRIDLKSHTKFAAKHQLPFPLLCDADAAVATAYGSYGLKQFIGKEFMGVFHHSFVIGPEGRHREDLPQGG